MMIFMIFRNLEIIHYIISSISFSWNLEIIHWIISFNLIVGCRQNHQIIHHEKNETDNYFPPIRRTGVRENSVSWHHGAQLRTPLESLEHHSSMLPNGSRGGLQPCPQTTSIFSILVSSMQICLPNLFRKLRLFLLVPLIPLFVPLNPQYHSAVMVEGDSRGTLIVPPWCRDIPASRTATRLIAVFFSSLAISSKASIINFTNLWSEAPERH